MAAGELDDAEEEGEGEAEVNVNVGIWLVAGFSLGLGGVVRGVFLRLCAILYDD